MGGRRVLLAGVVVLAGLSTVGLDYWRDYRADQDVAQLRDMLEAASPSHPAYDHLRVVRSTHPQVWIFGMLDSRQQIDELRTSVARLFGEEEARRIVSQVHVPEGMVAPTAATTTTTATTSATTRAIQ